MNVTIWTRHNCSYCDQAKSLLQQRGIIFEEKKLDEAGGYTKEDLLLVAPNARTVPQIFIDGRLIGGFSDLTRYFEGTVL